jgi:hypothetical protein
MSENTRKVLCSASQFLSFHNLDTESLADAGILENLAGFSTARKNKIASRAKTLLVAHIGSRHIARRECAPSLH